MKWQNFVVIGLSGITFTLRSATIIWSGGGDGTSWSNPLNWTGGSVPTASDNAVLGAGGAVVLAGDLNTVLSIQSERPITITSGALRVTGGDSEIKGPFTLLPWTYLSVAGGGTTFLCTNTVTADRASLYAETGGEIRLPRLTSAHHECDNWMTWHASGAGSLLDLSGVTNVTAGDNCGYYGYYLQVQTYDGGQVICSNLTSVSTNLLLRIAADGAGSVTDFRALTNFPEKPGRLDLAALNGGQVILPLLVDGRSTTLTLANGGVMDTAQLTRIGGVTVDNQSVTLAAVTNLAEATSLLVYNGGYLALPLVTSYSVTQHCGISYWNAYGAGSVLDLASLTNLPNFVNYCGSVWVEAREGGQVILSNLVAVATNLSLRAYAEGTNSLVDLSQLAVFPETPGWLDLHARDGGQVKIPLLVDANSSTISLVNGGLMDTAQLHRISSLTLGNQSLTLPLVTNLAGSTGLYLYNGAQLALPEFRSYAKMPGCVGHYLHVDGVGSVLDLSALTNVPYAEACGTSINATCGNGGQIVLSNLVTVATNTSLQVYAQGAGSVIDLGKLANFPEAPAMLDLSAYSGGQIKLPFLVDGRSANFGVGDGGVLDTAQLHRVRSFTVQNQVVTLPAVTNLDDTIGLYVSGGGYLAIPQVGTYEKSSACQSVTWQASGSGSVLDLSAITNQPNSSGNCGTIYIHGLDDGLVVLSNLVAAATNAYWRIIADGAGSVVDLSKLANFPSSAGGLDVGAYNGGEVRLPLLVDGSSVSLTLRNGGVLTAPQLSRIYAVTADNQTATLAAVTNLHGLHGSAALSAQNGAQLLLPQVETYYSDGCDTLYLSAGTDGFVILPALTNVFMEDCGGISLHASHGGQIVLSNLISISNGGVHATASLGNGQGTNSGINLDRLASYTSSTRWFDLQVYEGGEVTMSQLVDGRRVLLSLQGNGLVSAAQFTGLGGLTVVAHTNAFPALTNLDNAFVHLSAGAKVEFPALQAISVLGDCAEVVWRVIGPDSQLSAPTLTSIFRAEGGCAPFALEARSSGMLILSNLATITGPTVNIFADSSGSVVDLSSLNSFIAPLGQNSGLSAQAGGNLLFGSQAFLLANVNVDIPPGNPLLPPVFIAGPNLSLYGTPWLSYLIEKRPTQSSAASWEFYSRVPQTNLIQQVGGPPAPNTAYRVTELLANPPILEFALAPDNKLQLLLYGLNNSTYPIETATNLALANPWLPYTSVAMTNSFRFVAPISQHEPERYFRFGTP